MWDQLFQPVDLLQTGLSAGWKRDSVIRNNIANYETPGFKSSNLEFESIFAAALNQQDTTDFPFKMTRDKHIEFGEKSEIEVGYRVTTDRSESMRMDENNVDIEAENAKLAKNTIWYNTVMSKLNSELTKIKLAVTEGR